MRSTKKVTTVFILIIFLSSSGFAVIGNEEKRNAEINNDNPEYSDIKEKEINLNFSKPEIVPHEDYYIVRVSETNHNSMVLFEKNPGRPVLPVKIKVFNFPFSTKIEEISYIKGKSTEEDIPGKFSFGKARNDALLYNKPINFDQVDESYPSDWISFKKAGGLEQGEHTTFLILRVYPVVYYQSDNKIEYIQNISINIKYKTPKQPVVNQEVYDLLIISPSEFEDSLEKLVEHKESLGISTKIATVNEIKERSYWEGRDLQEKIKYYIKESILNWGIKYVLLVGGIEGQTFKWNIPVRYSHVVPYSEQEYPEKSFISDLYYADVFDAQANFSSWDSNNDGRYSVWNKSFVEEMDLYPDVYLGRLPCRNRFELRAMINKIIEYEKDKCDESWFKNLVLIAGDSYHDENGFNEGQLISEKAAEIMDDFNPIKVYASTKGINRESVNSALEQGAGFAYFCGHGSPASWNTHFPPDGKEWAEGYQLTDMIFLRNKDRLPVTIVGGCHNGQFDVTMARIVEGVRENGLNYFRRGSSGGQFWYTEWVPNCWAWWLTSKPNGGAIATIANTGLGTHGDDDVDNDSVADYLQVLDGWLELRFLELYDEDDGYILGQNHGQTITEYLHKFLGDKAVMDVKMAQQWELFGDPSLKIGGYGQ